MDAQHQHEGICQRGDEGRDRAIGLIEPGELHVLLVHRRLKARPAPEVAVLCAACLDRLDHLDAGDGSGRKLARVSCLHAGDIDPLFRKKSAHHNIDEDADEPHQRQKRAVAQHDDKVKHHHHGAEEKRRQRVHKLLCDDSVCLMARQDVPRHALGEELHRHFENFPHKTAAADYRHFSVGFQRIDRTHRCGKDLQNAHPRDEGDKRHEKFIILAGQQPIYEETGEGGAEKCEHRTNHAGQHDEGHGRARANEPLAGKGEGACPFSIGVEIFSRRKAQHDAGVRLIKFLHRHTDATPRRVVHVSVLPAKAAEHHKMIEIPMDDARKVIQLFDSLQPCFIALGFQTVASRSF